MRHVSDETKTQSLFRRLKLAILTFSLPMTVGALSVAAGFALVLSGCQVQIIGAATIRPNITTPALISPILTPATLSLAVTNVSTLVASSGEAPYTYSLVSGGGSIDPVTGVYTAPGAAGSAVVRVTDAQGLTADSAITILPALSISPSSATLAVNATQAFSGQDGVPPYSYSITAGIGSIDAVTGVYTAASSAGSSTVRVSDSLGNTADASITITPPPLNLEVPIEMIGHGIHSWSGAGTDQWGLSRTELRTASYDGTVTYSFEIAVSNSDSVSRSVYLMDSSSAVKATVAVPASTENTRIRASFTPNTGTDTYFIRMDKTTAGGNLILRNARILVHQVGATKTRLYFPLSGGDEGYSSPHFDEHAYTTSTSFTAVGPSNWGVTAYPPYLKDSSLYASLAGATPWMFEALFYTANGANPAEAVLYNMTDGAAVAASSLITAQTGPNTLQQVALSNAAVGFDEGDVFEVRYRASGGAGMRFQKAGLWLSLENLTKGEVFYRISRGRDYIGAGTSWSAIPTLIDTSVFSSPKVFFETAARTVNGGQSFNFRLYTIGSNESSTAGTQAGATLIAGSTHSGSTATKTRFRSGELTITSGDRFLAGYQTPGGGVYTSPAFMVIRFGN